MRLISFSSAAFLMLLFTAPTGGAQIAAPLQIDSGGHSSEEWVNIEQHLSNPASSDAKTLETAADTLRARRYPSEAVRYYGAALEHGGNPVPLMKKMGIACLEMQQIGMAHTYFQQAARTDKNDAGAWNNLGASEFILRNTGAAIRDYRKAVKLDGSSASYHANLALAYFEAHKAKAARGELAKGLALDPDLLHRSSRSGYTAQVLASEHYSAICFEMARIYAAQNNLDAVIEWLTKASDRGFDVRHALDHDAALRPLLAEPRVQVLLKNGDSLQAGSKPPKGIPSLGPADR